MDVYEFKLYTREIIKIKAISYNDAMRFLYHTLNERSVIELVKTYPIYKHITV
jgi:hypothetical protein